MRRRGLCHGAVAAGQGLYAARRIRKKIKTLIEKGSVAVCREMVQANHKFS